mgnify:CR=1 FL=1
MPLFLFIRSPPLFPYLLFFNPSLLSLKRTKRQRALVDYEEKQNQQEKRALNECKRKESRAQRFFFYCRMRTVKELRRSSSLRRRFFFLLVSLSLSSLSLRFLASEREEALALSNAPLSPLAASRPALSCCRDGGRQRQRQRRKR